MLSHPMTKARRLVLIAMSLAAFAGGVSACGTQEISPELTGANLEAAEIFVERCSGCHTLKAAGTQGTGNRGLRTQGPNLDQRTETYEDALFAIRNGGFSGAIMPANIVVGRDAEYVADFVSKYAGKKSSSGD